MDIKSRRRLIFYASALVVAVISVYLWRDFHLQDSGVKLPDVVVEGIELSRVIKGDKWKLTSPKVEHKDGVINGVSIDVKVDGADGAVSNLFADSGRFYRDNNEVELEKVNGKSVKGEKVFDFSAGAARYDSKKEAWDLSGGVVISGDSVVLSGPNGHYDTKSGIGTVSGGTTARWGF